MRSTWREAGKNDCDRGLLQRYSCRTRRWYDAGHGTGYAAADEEIEKMTIAVCESLLVVKENIGL